MTACIRVLFFATWIPMAMAGGWVVAFSSWVMSRQPPMPDSTIDRSREAPAGLPVLKDFDPGRVARK